MATITNMDDVINSRDIIERIEELEIELEDGMDNGRSMPDEQDELTALKALAEEASCSPDWLYGEMLIRDSYFEEYAQELAEDCGMVTEGANWPNSCIDWEQATRELQQDYMNVEFDGVDYWIRA
ncbi:hypothetical protein LCGC14_1966940 [marine sediment metagenome]|uniref:Uncharacterized protein n=1 Tax=marine sediment metagenome TaxID=412755 RepID=A0A0F9I9W6_9ZZZZ